MSERIDVTRRTLLKAVGIAGVGLGGAVLAAPAERKGAGARKRELPAFRNEQFYKDKKFDLEAAKDALIELMRFHRYPVFPKLRENLWVSDYGLGEFATVGLGACIFMNNEKGRFMLLDIYLLPNQMLPEHYHLETKKGPPKMEGWLVRHGLSYIVGEGEKSEGVDKLIPASQKKHVTTFHVVAAQPGDHVELNRPTARHWQYAGPEGAILSEAANFHDGEGVRHTNPNIVL